ncbi:hypothetical protein G7Y89_g171 [Cudoniella acicularis]|uniref:Xaa-Pro aminopeptidase n=1 Tax=Cudoniella acicularis TaxID=354080 RepID=A0A8H4RXN2_9HELO|nr:hypothetical protein G7Y89_g171 [Cudoniella acicularis]
MAQPSSNEADAQNEWAFTDEVEHDAILVDAVTKPKEKYPAKLHAQKVIKNLGSNEGIIYLPATPSMTYEDSDQEMLFRQRRYFYYLSGINYPNCAITYHIKGDVLIAWIPPQNVGSKVIFNGFNPTKEEIGAIADFDDVSNNSELEEYLGSFISNEKGKIYLLHNDQQPKFRQQVRRPNDQSSPYESVSLIRAMDSARVIKSLYEIEAIRKANDITTKAHFCVSEQAKQQAYGIIAGSGENASTLHYGANNEPLKGRQLVCLDAGSEWECYASDVTRTFPISGKWTKEAKEIYDIVEQMQEECIKMVKPGVNYLAIHMHAHEVATKGLLKLGILQNGTYDELFWSGISRAFFSHGLGHYVGLEVHDVGKYGALLYGAKGHRSDWTDIHLELLKSPEKASSVPLRQVLEPNMVITVEPGIYFSKYALEDVYLKDKDMAKYINKDLLAKYYPVGGVRIEDDLLVTEDGYENLTTTPKGDAALKIINEGKEKVVEERMKRGWFW